MFLRGKGWPHWCSQDYKNLPLFKVGPWLGSEIPDTGGVQAQAG